MKEWLTVAEAAVLVKRHQSRVYAWLKSGELKSHTDASGVLLVRADDALRVESKQVRGRRPGTVIIGGRR